MEDVKAPRVTGEVLLVTTSKAPVTTSKAPVTTSVEAFLSFVLFVFSYLSLFGLVIVGSSPQLSTCSFPRSASVMCLAPSSVANGKASW